MILFLAPLVALAAALGFTAWKARVIAMHFPRHGELTDVGGYMINSLHLPADMDADLPPVVFIHGASGNLRDQETAFRSSLEGRAQLLFVDRPGHGYSERGGPQNNTPDGQATAIARLMDLKGIDRAIIVGHSFGGAIAASFAVLHPGKTAGLLFLAPATHPWPGGIDSYYRIAASPWLGWWFTRMLTLPAGLLLMDGATKGVFRPNRRRDRYVDEGAPALVLRPENFRNNAIDVAGLHAYVTRMASRYAEITAPTVIITGDSDPIVLQEIHSQGLARDIAGSELVMIHGLGHKPDYVVTDVAVAAIEKLAGMDRDLETLARQAEARIASSVGPAPPPTGPAIERR